MIGQKKYAAASYSRRLHTQLDLASYILVAYPRVHRFLVESGLHNPKRHHNAAHTSAVTKAVERYASGEPVALILKESGLVASELYRGLRFHKVPLRKNIVRRKKG